MECVAQELSLSLVDVSNKEPVSGVSRLDKASESSLESSLLVSWGEPD